MCTGLTSSSLRRSPSSHIAHCFDDAPRRFLPRSSHAAPPESSHAQSIRFACPVADTPTVAVQKHETPGSGPTRRAERCTTPAGPNGPTTASSIRLIVRVRQLECKVVASRADLECQHAVFLCSGALSGDSIWFYWRIGGYLRAASWFSGFFGLPGLPGSSLRARRRSSFLMNPSSPIYSAQLEMGSAQQRWYEIGGSGGEGSANEKPNAVLGMRLTWHQAEPFSSRRPRNQRAVAMSSLLSFVAVAARTS